MAGVKKIEAFEISDGRVFKDEATAQALQREIDIRVKLNSLVESECWSGMNSSDVLDFMVENYKVIEKIFK